MIPLRLSIRNFLCYKENVPSLDFTGIHLACLCGDNGHGKSALLDAITWSLWGKARGRTQDDLISYGADEARVELEFVCRDTNYRVIRSHAKGIAGRRRTGASDLQLQILNGSDAQPISGNSIRETQTLVEQLVGMDYDTFINSAFLIQGRADEFASKTPSERKAVLASILGLNMYDEYQERARKRLSETRSIIDQSVGVSQQLEKDREDLGDPTIELQGVEKHLLDTEKQINSTRQELEQLRHRVREIEEKQAAISEERKQIDQLENEIGALSSSAISIQQRIGSYSELISQTDSIRTGLLQFTESKSRFESLEAIRGRHIALNDRKAQLQQSTAGKRNLLESQIQETNRKISSELIPIAESEPRLLEQRDQLYSDNQKLNAKQHEFENTRKQQQLLANRITQTDTTSELYKREGEELARKLALLNNLEGSSTDCPLCGTTLAKDSCQGLANTYQVEIEDKRRLYRENQSLLKSMQTDKSLLDNVLTKDEQDISSHRTHLEVSLANIDRQIQESQRAQKDLSEMQSQLDVYLNLLASGRFAEDETRDLVSLEAEITDLGYDEELRQQAYSEMRQLQAFEQRGSALDQALAQLPVEQSELSQTTAILTQRTDDLVIRKKKILDDQIAIEGFSASQKNMATLERDLETLERGQMSAISRRGFLEGQLSRLEELAKELDLVEARRIQLEEDQGIYQELATAFGRQGIQAMLIETVIPQLEEEANDLLGRMTDNQMHLKLETQRERRSGRGEPIETLEINVSDELGPRNYELYSGGESFRINLALRIALSKVLSQRVGATLPTLFIDEGFGTQDSVGRERIMDVISSIEDDFDKIIVITHLEDLKDMFPARIEVLKTNEGSTLWLS